ncbi:MAG: alpha/beta hydrolase [Actinomycetota bacterium]
MSFLGSGGVRLAADVVGDPGGPPAVFFHGAGQTRHAWGAAADQLAAAGWYAVAVDLRGHGDSDWPGEGGYGLERFAEDVVAVVGAVGAAPAVVAASLGGMAVLAAQGRHPDQLFQALVLVDVTPRLELNGVRRVVGFMAAHPDGFASLEEAGAAIAGYLPERSRRRELGGLTRVLRQRGDGRWQWRWDPRLLAEMDPAAVAQRTATLETVLTAAARRVKVPTLVVRGGRSDVISDQGVAHFLDAVPHATPLTVPDAGHMVAGDRNDAFCGAIVAFLAQHQAGCRR